MKATSNAHVVSLSHVPQNTVGVLRLVIDDVIGWIIYIMFNITASMDLHERSYRF